jgi:retron-type reverse transcriptase
MQNAETVLSVLRERGRRGLACEELYRQMFNPQLYLLAYGRIYANAMTAGVTPETVDGMSVAKIGRIIEAIRFERYRFHPVRRTHIPKRNGKTRPLGLPTWSDKLVGEVVRLLLEAYYEPQFSDRSHGFRPGRGCHTALLEVVNTWTGTAWFIEGDVSDCFGSLDHQVMLAILAERILDGRFLRLVGNMLAAGYLEDWVWHGTLSGVPQGGLCSAEHNDPNEQRWVMRKRPAVTAGGCGRGDETLRITPGRRTLFTRLGTVPGLRDWRYR